MKNFASSKTAYNTWLAASLHRVGLAAFYKLYLLWRLGRKVKENWRPAASPERCVQPISLTV
jgi:hypothetical protein